MKLSKRQLRRIIRKVIKESSYIGAPHPNRDYRGGRSPVRTGIYKKRTPDEWYIGVVQEMRFEQAEEWLRSLDLPETHVLYFLAQHPDCPDEIKEA